MFCGEALGLHSEAERDFYGTGDAANKYLCEQAGLGHATEPSHLDSYSLRVVCLSFGVHSCDWCDERKVMNRRTVVLTEIIAPYRIPVFNALARRAGVDLHAIFLAETDTTLRHWPIYSDEIRFSYEVLPSWRWRAGRLSLLLNRGLRSALQAANPQAILCGGYNYPASWESLWWARQHNVRFVLWIESNQQDKRSGRAGVERLKRYFVSSCNAFVVPGKSSFAYLRSFGVSEQVIFTAPNAVDNMFFTTQAEKAKRDPAPYRERLGLPRRFILFVGRLVPEKGVFDLLQAYANLESGLRSEVGLVFAGDGVSKEELGQRAKQISPGTVCFSGFADREDLAGLYALAEALVLPTHSDPWGLVVNEAMACGLPIIVTSVAGCSADLVEDGWNGYIVPARDSEKLSVAMNSLVRQPELRQRMGTHSSERIRSYSPEACADGLAASASTEAR
jgi:1,2-diacylglycerol 3-alpha-glucosyltransferase